jgi:hypothetical protein
MGMSEFYGPRDEAEPTLAQGQDVISIPGTKRRSYLEERMRQP